MIKPGWIPPRSPYGLIQEDLWPNEWLCLVACILLNCTRRVQVERALPTFLERWPTPQAMLTATVDEIIPVIKPLGFSNRRAKNLLAMTRAFLCGPWEHANELPGIGQYGHASHEIFYRGNVPVDPPKDHALMKYVIWYNRLHGIGV